MHVRDASRATKLGSGVMEAFAKRLRELRTARGISQEALAAAAGASKATIQNWENQRRSPSLRDAARIADVLQVSLDELAGRSFRSPGEGLDGLVHLAESLSDPPEVPQPTGQRASEERRRTAGRRASDQHPS